MKIGILQTGHAPDELLGKLGDYDAMFERLLGGHGFEFETFNVVDMEFPDSPDAADGWLITGSRHGAYDNLPFIPPLEDLIRTVHDSDRPLVGICFGHQIVAQALGGKVEKFEGGWAVGRTEYIYRGAPLALNAWHQDQVTEVPDGAIVMAHNKFCRAAALAYGDRIWTIQPHPEFGSEAIEGLVKSRGRGVVPDDLIDQAIAGLSGPTAGARIAEDIAAFLKREKKEAAA